jgi:hypothetical protein
VVPPDAFRDQHIDVRAAAAERPGALTEPFDVALLANLLYYLSMAERVGFLRGIADLMAPGGVVFLVTTVAAPQFFSRHFDLLLQSQEGQMELSDAGALVDQLEQAGFRAGKPRPVAPACPECGEGGLWRRLGSRPRFPTLGVRPGR